jgi:hypothetical protein
MDQLKQKAKVMNNLKIRVNEEIRRTENKNKNNKTGI